MNTAGVETWVNVDRGAFGMVPCATISAMTAGAPDDGMPEDLADAVANYDTDIRQLIVDNWRGIGEAGRRECLHYIAAALTHHGRRERSKVIAAQLINPDHELGIGW